MEFPRGARFTPPSIEAISEPMRELIEDLRPELVYKLPPKRPHS
jgi:hypothetical protein